MKNKSIIRTDSYKASHYLQYPPNTKKVYSYIAPRNVTNEYFPVTEGVMLFGTAYVNEKILRSPPLYDADIAESEALIKRNGLPFSRADWEAVNRKLMHNMRFPIEFTSLKEGTLSPEGVVQVQVSNIGDEFYWLTSYFETQILRTIWYGSTVATLSHEIKLLLKNYMEISCDTLDGLKFKLHDFGARGATSSESAAIGGLAHLMNFVGTDNLEALALADELYGVGNVTGLSIPAAEHSTMTAWGRHSEEAAYANMVRQFGGPGKMYAVVSDSYDIFNAVENIWCDKLKELVVDIGGTVVIRPDSGDPVETPLKVIELLGNSYGYTTNSKGYKVLHDSVRVIQGDGINYWSIKDICEKLVDRGWSLDNIAFGMGGALLQRLDRDTLGYAMKASAVDINGKIHDVGKDPIDSTKKSLKGIRHVTKDKDGNFINTDSPNLQTGEFLLTRTNYYWEGQKG